MTKGVLTEVLGEKRAAKIAAKRDKLRMRFRFLAKGPGSMSLRELGSHHGTDKGDANHSFGDVSFLDIYERYLCDLRGDPVSLLEIGVNEGESLRTWKSYFPEGQVYGVDINPDCRRHEEKRIQIEIGSQGDTDFLAHCFGAETAFDVIIDDGSHVNWLTIASFENLFRQRLKPGGLYIIEDLGASYEPLQSKYNVLEKWPGMNHNDPALAYDNDRRDMDRFFEERVRALDEQNGQILFIHFWSRTCVIGKLAESNPT